MQPAKKEPFSTWGCKLESWWERKLKADGTPGKRWILQCAWYTPINTCDRCGVKSGPRKVKYRPTCHGVAGYNGMLCMGCWNKLRVIGKLQEDAALIKWAAAKIKREAKKHGNEKRRDARDAPQPD